MEVYKFLNIIGLFLILNGSYYGVRGEFIQKNSLLLGRTQLHFSNMEHFKSMILNKYNLIFGFFFICLGTITQGISLVVEPKKFFNVYICLCIFILLIILMIIGLKCAKNIAEYYYDTFTLNYWYKEYLGKKTINEDTDISFLKEFARILKLKISDENLINDKNKILEEVRLYLLKKEKVLLKK